MSTPARNTRSKSSSSKIFSPSALDFDACTLTPRIHEFKVVIVGDAGVGKSSFVKRHARGSFQGGYECTRGADTCTLNFDTNRGIVKLHIWDTAGVEKLKGLGDGYYVGSQGAIIMFDLESCSTFNNIVSWHRSISRVCPDIPTVLLGNKSESKSKKVKTKKNTFLRKVKEFKYFETSAKSNINLSEPLLHLARKLMGDHMLEFVKKPASLHSPDLESDDDPTDVETHIEHSFYVDGQVRMDDGEKQSTDASREMVKFDLSVAAATPLPNNDNDDV